MTVTFIRHVIKDNGANSFCPCKYTVYKDSALIGQFEYYSEHAYFTIENKRYTINSKINFPFFIPLLKYVITENDSGDKLGEFETQLLKLYRLKLINQKVFDIKRKRTNESSSVLLLSNKNISISYHFPENSFTEEAHRKNMKGEIELDSLQNLIALFSGFFLVEIELGNYNYDPDN